MGILKNHIARQRRNRKAYGTGLPRLILMLERAGKMQTGHIPAQEDWPEHSKWVRMHPGNGTYSPEIIFGTLPLEGEP